LGSLSDALGISEIVIAVESMLMIPGFAMALEGIVFHHPDGCMGKIKLRDSV
jgi:hypothetical protein